LEEEEGGEEEEEEEFFNHYKNDLKEHAHTNRTWRETNHVQKDDEKCGATPSREAATT